MTKRFAFVAMLALAAVLAFGCAAPFAGPSGGVQSPGTGTLQIRVTDAPKSDRTITKVYVEVNPVDGIQIHRAGSDNSDEAGDWISANISAANNPFELLALKNSNGLYAILGDANLPSGNYTQIRMDIKSVTVTINGENETATVPSGKIKFVRPFEVANGATTVLTFDFDAEKSINVTGNGKVMMKPVIKLTVEKPSGGQNENGNENEHGQAISISPSGLPNGVVGTPYASALYGTGGTGNYTWSITNGSLPSGLSINATSGLISGTPDAAGTSHFAVGVSDNATPANTGSRQYTVTIAATGSFVITTTSLPDALHGFAYGPITLQTAGGTPNYTWSQIGSGTVPPGMSFDLVAGSIGGTPTTVGQWTFTVKVVDGANRIATQTLTIKVN